MNTYFLYLLRALSQTNTDFCCSLSSIGRISLDSRWFAYFRLRRYRRLSRVRIKTSFVFLPEFTKCYSYKEDIYKWKQFDWVNWKHLEVEVQHRLMKIFVGAVVLTINIHSPGHLVLSVRKRPLVTTLTTSLHPNLSWAASFNCWSHRPVVSTTSSIHLLLDRPLPLPPFPIPNINVFSRPSLRTTWPKFVSLSFHTLWSIH